MLFFRRVAIFLSNQVTTFLNQNQMLCFKLIMILNNN